MIDARQLLVDNRMEFEFYLRKAQSHCRSEEYERAAAFAQTAAGHAWLRHPGFFHSPELATILTEISYKAIPAVDLLQEIIMVRFDAFYIS